MKLITRNNTPARRDVFADFFDEFFTSGLMPATGKLAPAVDIIEEKDRYVVTADLPGLKQEEVKVEFNDGVLRIHGERSHEKKEEDKEKHYHYYERSYGSFERRFVLPRDTDAEKIKAAMKDGVLEVEIPKTEAKKPKEIKVE